jgi:hypothetical protein
MLVAGLVSRWVCRPPLVHSLSWGELFASALLRLLIVFLASAVTVRALCAAQQEVSKQNVRRVIFQTSLDALWFAPLTFFILENSALSMAIAPVLVVSAAKSFFSLQNRLGHSEAEESRSLSLNDYAFSWPHCSSLFRRQVSSAGAAMCAQTGVLAGFAGYTFASAAMVSISTAVWRWSFTQYAPPDQPSTRSRSGSRILLIVTLAIVFTAGALLPYLRQTAMIAGFGVPSLNHTRHSLFSAGRHRQTSGDKTSNRVEQLRVEKAGGEQQRAQPSNSKEFEDLAAAARDANSGIILWPKKQIETKLVAPAPAVGNGLLKSNRRADPLIIPFNGVYWFFKAPDLRPPRTSRETQGSPDLLDIHSTDRRPLSMEAHEHLGSLIDLGCCSRIQIAIRNADLYSETVSLELTLINGSLPGKPSQSLGSVIVKSTPPWKLYDNRPLANETLNFVVPPNPAIRRFDEVRVVFRLDAFRADDGAKIAIDHFVLIPRGF